MIKLKSSLLNMFVSLTAICAVAAASLATVNELTSAPIAAMKKQKLENAIKIVVPAFDNSPTEEAYFVASANGDSIKIYPATKDGKLVGNAIESSSMLGYSGEIKIIIGFDVEGKIVDYAVLQHAETPGLGDKMQAWFRSDKNNQNILGRDLSTGLLRLNKDGGDVDAITAATISSRAFIEAVNKAYLVQSGSSDAVSGATVDADSAATSAY